MLNFSPLSRLILVVKFVVSKYKPKVSFKSYKKISLLSLRCLNKKEKMTEKRPRKCIRKFRKHILKQLCILNVRLKSIFLNFLEN